MYGTTATLPRIARLLRVRGRARASFKPYFYNNSTPNNLSKLTELLMEAAAEVGFLRKVPVLVDGVPEVNATSGAPTGRVEWEMNPEEGLKG